MQEPIVRKEPSGNSICRRRGGIPIRRANGTERADGAPRRVVAPRSIRFPQGGHPEFGMLESFLGQFY